MSVGVANGTMGIAYFSDRANRGRRITCVVIKFGDDSIVSKMKDEDGCFVITHAEAAFPATNENGDVERHNNSSP